MSRPDESRGRTVDGFEGEVAGLELSDLIQINARKHFSGCFRIRYEGQLGLIFFRDGEVVHAEQGARVGEEAFADILAWPTGHFSVEPNVVTARKTIQKGCEHLLLETHRIIDERRSGRDPASRPAAAAPAPAPAPQATPVPQASQVSAADRARAVPGVAEAAVLTRDGKRVSEGGHEADVVTGQAAYLAMMGAELGAHFQAGELRFASVQATRQHLLLFAAKAYYLGVSVRPDSELGAVDAAIRAALAVRR
jgi:predicted regulator of Ras-like GTPase activity (Roadblock/LC7/MglB family)